MVEDRSEYDAYVARLAERVPGDGKPSNYPVAVHDYTQEGLYTDHGDDRVLWSWEFIRRNPRYQYLTDRMYVFYDVDTEAEIARKLGVDFFPWRVHWATDIGEGLPAAIVEGHAHMLQLYTAPHTLFKPGLRIENCRAVEAAQRSLFDVMKFQEEEFGVSSDACIGLAFDLSLPIEPQVRRARELLRSEKERLGVAEGRAMKSPTIGRGVRWLRVLDGIAAGAGPTEIQKALGIEADGTSRYQALAAAALKRRDSNSRQLVGLHRTK